MAKGITFDEVMAGPFALGVSDPLEGRDKGEREGSKLSLNASVSIPDLDAFIADPKHLGGLSGSVDFPPLGKGLRATSGVFNLFSPTGGTDLKLMVYEMGFQVEAKAYYLAGKKEVRDDPGIDLWSDTTTLYTTLHEGGDKEAPIVGAGVLTLGVAELAELLSTVRVTGTDSAFETAATIAKFGRFFMGELWDTYGPEAVRG